MRIQSALTALAAVLFVATAAPSQDRTPAGPHRLGDLRAAQSIEVRDASGGTVLQGQFETRSDDGKEARLTGAGDARGEADLDLDDDEQELEIEVRGLAPNAEFSVWIDGREAGSFQTDERGRAGVEWEDRRSPPRF